MNDPKELLEEFERLTPLEEAAKKTGEDDGIKLMKILGLLDQDCMDESRRELNCHFYFRNKTGITYRKHSRFTRSDTHRHDFFEIAYAYKGNFTQTINNDRVTVKEGSLILLDTNVFHSIDRIGEDTILINILISREYFSNTLLKLLRGNMITEFIFSSLYKESLKGSYLHFTLDRESPIRNYINELLLEIRHDAPGSDAIVNSFMVIILSRLAREQNCLNSPPNTGLVAPATVIKVLDYINRNHMSLNLTDTAEHFHFSPNYLSSLLKKYTGKSYLAIVLDLKLEKAALLLKNTTFSISRISETAGFHNTAYFYKLFEDKYNCTPKSYRDKPE